MLTLYDAALSGNCHKIRLLLSLLGLEHQSIEIAIHEGETRTDAFRQINPRSQVPVLKDDEITIWDSQAILVYLARRYGGETWLPSPAEQMAQVMQWLAVSENELLYGLAKARRIHRYHGSGDLEEARLLARSGLAVLNQRLETHDWLALDRPTIAEAACYPYISMADEAGISLDDYPAVQAWLKRLAELPGFLGMEAFNQN